MYNLLSIGYITNECMKCFCLVDSFFLIIFYSPNTLNFYYYVEVNYIFTV